MKSSASRPAAIRRNSFTLVEMLVAIAVLSLLVLAMAQMTQLVSNAWRAGQNRVDNFTKSRATLDLVTGDLQRGVFRNDIPSFLVNASTLTTNGATYFTGGTYTNAFFTRTAGLNQGSTAAVRDLSLVAYGLDATNVFQRSDLALNFTNAASATLVQIPFGNDTGSNGGFVALLGSLTPRPQAPGVVGFTILFRRQDGTVIPSSSYTGEDFTHGPVTAIGVALAVVSEQSLNELAPAQLTQLAQKLAATPITASGSAKAAWDQAMIDQNLFTQYRKDLSTSFKTFERWVACQPF